MGEPAVSLLEDKWSVTYIKLSYRVVVFLFSLALYATSAAHFKLNEFHILFNRNTFCTVIKYMYIYFFEYCSNIFL